MKKGTVETNGGTGIFGMRDANKDYTWNGIRQLKYNKHLDAWTVIGFGFVLCRDNIPKK